MMDMEHRRKDVDMGSPNYEDENMYLCHFLGKEFKSTFLPSPSYIRKSIALKVAKHRPYLLMGVVQGCWQAITPTRKETS